MRLIMTITIIITMTISTITYMKRLPLRREMNIPQRQTLNASTGRVKTKCVSWKLISNFKRSY